MTEYHELPDIPSADHPGFMPPDHPERIGSYRILQVLGEGGMGIVYEADQVEPVRRRVALKILKPGMDTKQILARFEAERQALAVMEHPNIAKVLDAGATEGGRPYFAMELVHGVKLTNYCDQHRLPIRRRLELFIDVCHAIQHAHQKGVIHRDLKPSNVLVTERDNKPIPMVIDFGIAKAISQRLTERTLVTQQGQAMGTPAYMSPEQAEMSGLDVDTRTDVYSLGVMLYELLVGRLPLDPDEVGINAFFARLVMREMDHKTPSAEFSTPGENAQAIARQRRGDPATLRRELQGDLDWIVMKAMETDRNRRYETVNGLAMDIQRHLNDEAVVARPPSTRYRLAKFVRRNRTAVGAGALIAASLVVGAGAATVGMVRATRAEAAAAREAETAQQVSDFLVGLFKVSNPSEARGNTVTAREILDVGAERIGTELADQPVVQARLLNTIGTVFRQMGLLDRARPLLQQALALRQAELGANHADVGASLYELAWLNRIQGNLSEAEPLAQRALSVTERALGPDDPAVASSATNLAAIYMSQEKFSDAELLFQRAVAIYERVPNPDRAIVASSRSNLGVLYLRRGRLDEAESQLERALEIRERVLEPDHPSLAANLLNLGAVYWTKGRYGDAESVYRRAREIFEKTLDPEHPRMASILNNLGETYLALERYDEAEPLLTRALTVKEKIYDPNHASIATTVNALANLHRHQRRYGLAEREYQRALRIRERAMGPTAAKVAETLEDYGRMLREAGRASEAEPVEARAAAIRSGRDQSGGN
ncbi:MAG: serine/threonine protein kinase [Gemmatimonadetes bacterium]|nr:serine/threonine protein kinase [Gemmatimonadota bacterium]